LRVFFGDFALDLESRQLHRAGEEVRLGPKTFDLLALLASQRPRALSKAYVRDALWPRISVAESNLTSLVAELRDAIDDDAKSPRFIRTVRGFGYAFCGAVHEGAALPRGRGSEARHVRLQVQDREVALREGENVLGRADEAVVWLNSSTVSRRHARILVDGVKATLEDLESRNGTYLRGERIRTPAALADGDEIRLGGVLLVFRSFAAAESTDAEEEVGR
jgi:DNA-binding winged helix-turn-helix (wHTH) protein